MKFNSKLLFLFGFLLILSHLCTAQEIKSFSDLSPEVQQKVNSNKASGLPIFNGVDFKYAISISENFKDTYPTDSDVEHVLSDLKNFFALQSYTYSYSSNGQLLINFQLENNLSFDEIKIKLTELRLYLTSINLTVSLK
ncbi:MAG: hypothetical protein J0L87_00255 [Bacteroidetes bacterium]|nr:hypothetical protein [Bacteroidota bacterium]